MCLRPIDENLDNEPLPPITVEHLIDEKTFARLVCNAIEEWQKFWHLRFEK